MSVIYVELENRSVYQSMQLDLTTRWRNERREIIGEKWIRKSSRRASVNLKLLCTPIVSNREFFTLRIAHVYIQLLLSIR